MKNVELVSAVINMQTVGQIWAHAILCMALETPGRAVPKPSASRSTRMESSPCWENWGCIQKRNLTQNGKKKCSIAFHFLCQASHLSYAWLIPIIKILMDQTALQPFKRWHQLWPVSILSYCFWKSYCWPDIFLLNSRRLCWLDTVIDFKSEF